MSLPAACGSWASPISAERVAAGGVRLAEARALGGDVYWLEGRPKEGGRSVVVCRRASGETTEITPAGANVRTLAHEYGGGSWLPTPGCLFYAGFEDQRVYRLDSGGEPRPITPEPPQPRSIRYADFELSPDGRLLYCVRERHEADGVANEIVALHASGASEAVVVASGHDFYAFPRLSPDGQRLAFTCWDHPQMPWDGTELHVGVVDASGGIEDVEQVAGGPGESVFQPEWSPSGVLHFVSDRSGWWNLYRRTGGDAQPLAPMNAEFGRPQWGFAMASYAFLADGRIVCSFGTGGSEQLGLIDRAGGGGLSALDTPYRSFGRVAAGQRGAVVLAASPNEAPAVVEIDLAGGEPRVLKRSSEDTLDPGYLSEPAALEFPTEAGRSAHALFYAPHNRDFSVPEDERPPLVVISHGGPTASTSSALNPAIQFWTSRGFAVVDVDYGGSTGYGRAYRERLRGQWGVVDTDDCVNAARHLARAGLVDGARMAIRGGSAGGYTTLCALTFHDVFAAGTSYYGVADAEALARDTHKFESRYLDSLIGPYPEARERYRERSPIHHADRLSCPLLLLQGLEDAVVPPSQAEVMVEALRKRGLPHAYLAFPGEQHGFRRAENIARSLEAELYFYGRVFGFAPADEIEPVPIENAERLPPELA